MTKSELFRKAHALAKQAIKAGDDYRITFGAALKALISKPASLLAQLTALGGKLWEKGSMRRVYFNDAHELIGLQYNTYGTGSISSATLNGEKISNSECKRILNRIGKIYFDLTDNKIRGTYTEPSMLDEIAGIIRAKLA